MLILQASSSATGLYLAFGIAAALAFLMIVGSVVYFGWKYRAGGKTQTRIFRHDSERTEMLLTIFFVVLAGGFMWMTLRTMTSIQDIPENPRPDIIVTGHQWWWEAEYTNGDFVVANELHLPTNKRLLVQLRSADVIHSWWVPALGRKMDMIPGVENNYIWLETKEAGEFLGACSEFCGAQHARMRLRVTVEPEEAFQEWSQNQAKSIMVNGAAAFAAGQKLFNEKTCATCHRIRGTAADGTVGPDLTHFGGRARFLADMKDNTPENLRAWLRDPQAVKPGVKMPDFLLSDQEISDLMAYLTQLK